jgi:hypothetical protein
MRSASSSALMAVFLLLLTTKVNGFWRMPCRSRSGLARVDPLVTNGTISQHAHAIHGSNGKQPLSEIDLPLAWMLPTTSPTSDKGVLT